MPAVCECQSLGGDQLNYPRGNTITAVWRALVIEQNHTTAEVSSTHSGCQF